MIQIATSVAENNHKCYLVLFLLPAFLYTLFTAHAVKSKSAKGILLSGFFLYGCRVFLEAAGKNDWILEHTRGPFRVYLLRQYCLMPQYIDKRKILLLLSILAHCTTSAAMLMNPQDEVLRYESVLCRKVHFLCKLK